MSISFSDTGAHVLKTLADGAWHHGSDMAEHLSISRTAIWKQVNALKELGYVIESVRSKGYQLKKPSSALIKASIESALVQLMQTNHLSLDVYPQLASTNDYLKEVSLAPLQCHVCLAEQQLKGRGRFSRHWHSPFGENLYLSMKTQLTIPFANMSGFSLCISLALINGLVAYGLNSGLFQIKWPNDLLINGEKLAGILIELSGEAGSGAQAIIGIGLNVAMQEADIDKQWTSLSKHYDEPIDRNRLAAHIIHALSQTIAQFETLGFASFQTAWQRYDALKNTDVALSFYDKTISGICQGIDEEGNIRIKHNDATVKSYSAGEVSFQLGES